MHKRNIIYFDAILGKIFANDTEVGRLNYSERLIFMLLISNRNKIISKDELLAAGWPERIVVSNSLTIAVRNIRSALERAGIHNEPETIPKMGYKLSIEVISIDHSVQQIEDVAMSNSAPTQVTADKSSFGAPELELDDNISPLSSYVEEFIKLGKKLYSHAYLIYIASLFLIGIFLYVELFFSEPIFQCVKYDAITFCGAHEIEKDNIPKSFINDGETGEYWFAERDNDLSFFKVN